MQVGHHKRAVAPWGQENFDRLLDRFEMAWRSGTKPAIRQFIQTGRADQLELLHELIKIDLEYRWVCAGQEGPGKQDGTALSSQPRLEEYAALFPQLGPPQRMPRDLIEEEYRVRQRWGDQPRHAEYTCRFPGKGAALAAALARIDAELATELAPKDVRKTRPLRECDILPPDQLGVERLHCPHCHQAMSVVASQLLRELTCPACGETFRVEPPSTIPDGAAQPPCRKLGRYELGELLGTGTFGSVWRAHDTELKRDVAVKLPRSRHLWGAVEEERFLREARSAAKLHHPGIVAVHDVGREGETLYIVSELVRGVDLEERLRRGRLSFLETAELLAQVAEALNYAHSQGVVHRDIKPSNIMLEFEQGLGETIAPACEQDRPARRPLVMDFGLALHDVGEVTMTRDGQLVGTPAYMSPEQIRNAHVVDGRSDVYSLGVILYELLTGELPFRGLTRMLLLQVVSDDPRPPRRLNDQIPIDLETICLKCLSKEPDARYRTAAELAADLRRWRSGQQILARPPARLMRLWLWTKRHPTLAAALGVGAATLVAVTGAPAATALVAASVASLLFALHKARAADELAQALEHIQRKQQKTAGVLQFALKHWALAREQRQMPDADTPAERRFTRARELARAVIFDFPEKLGDVPGARAFLIRIALAYLDGLAKEAGDDPLQLREVAVGYERVGDVHAGNTEDALACYQKSVQIFAALAGAHRDNAQAQRDLTASREKIADLRRTLAKEDHRFD